MTIPAVLAPLFVQVLLTFVVLVLMGRRRFASARAGEFAFKDIALGQNVWPERPALAGRNYENQFELPVLFYVLTILALFTRKADLLFVIMAWLFVLSRVAHAYVHVTSNRMPQRFQLFLGGVAVLALMWVIFMVRILLNWPLAL